jgi:hypothetical protein
MEAGSVTNSTRFDARRIVIGVIFVALLSAVRLRNDLLAIMLAVAYGLVVTLAPGATRPPIVRERWLDRIGLGRLDQRRNGVEPSSIAAQELVSWSDQAGGSHQDLPREASFADPALRWELKTSLR